MKKLLFCLLVLNVSTVVYAGACNDLEAKYENPYLSLGDLDETDQVLVDDNVTAPLFSKSLMSTPKVQSKIGEFDSEYCENSLSQKNVLISDTILEFVYTTDDSCDGGNNYGYIKAGNKVVGVIRDSEISCL